MREAVAERTISALLISIRGDAKLAGVRVGMNNTGTEVVRERCMADDTMVWAEGVASVE